MYYIFRERERRENLELIKSQKEDLFKSPPKKKNPKERFEIYLDSKCLRKGHKTMSMKSNLETAVYILCHSYTRKGFFFYFLFLFFMYL